MTDTTTDGVLETAAGRRIGWQLRGPRDGRMVGYLHGQPGSRKDTHVFDDASLARFDVRLLSIDRGGYGDTDPAGMDRRDVAGDLLTVADSLGVGPLPLLAVSMGGVYALTLAALVPERVPKVVLVSAHVLPYDDPAVVAALSEDEQADLQLLAGGRTPEAEAAYADAVASVLADPREAVRRLLRRASRHEQRLLTTPWVERIADTIECGLRSGHVGFLEDGLRTLRPLEIDLADIRCPVRAVHGTADDFEPFANLERLGALLDDLAVVALPGMGHFGPWLWSDLILSLLGEEP